MSVPPVSAQEVEVASSSSDSPSDSERTVVGSSASETGYVSGGVRLSRVPFRVVVSLSGGYDDNSGQNPGDSGGGAFSRASVVVTYSFQGPRFNGSLSTNSSFDYYFDRSDNAYRPNANLALTLGYLVSRRLTLNSSASILYQSEPDISLSNSPAQRGSAFWSYSASLGGSYEWLPRFSTATTYSISAVHYTDDNALQNTNAIVAAQDNFVHTLGQNARFLLLPATVITGNYSVTYAMYDASDRNSLSQSVLVGIDQVFGPRLRGTLQVGAQFHSSELPDGTELHRTSPRLDSTFSYQRGRTSVAWNSSYSIEESSYTDAAGPTTFRTGLQVTQSLTGRITATASGYYRHDDFEESGPGAPSSQDAIDLAFGLSYAISPRFSLSLDYQRTDLQSGRAAESYSRNRYLFGLQATF